MSGWGSSYQDKKYHDNYRGSSRGRGYSDRGSYSSNYNRGYSNNYSRGYSNSYNRGYSSSSRSNYSRGGSYSNRGYSDNYRGGGYSSRGSSDNYRGGGYSSRGYSDNYRGGSYSSRGYSDSYRGGSYNQSNSYRSNYERSKNSSYNDRGGSYQTPGSGVSSVSFSGWGQQAKYQNSVQSGDKRYYPQTDSNPKQVIEDDLGRSERPMFILSCYSHIREGPNDIDGDASFEELRWWTYSALAQYNLTQAQIMQGYGQAISEKEKAFAQLRKQAYNPPSKGGPAIVVKDPLQILHETAVNAPTNPFQSQQVIQIQPPPTLVVEEEEMEDAPSMNVLPFSQPQQPQQQPLQQPQQQYQFQQQQQLPKQVEVQNKTQQVQQQPSSSLQIQQQLKSTTYDNVQNVQSVTVDVWKLPKFQMGMIPEEPPPPEACY